MRLDYHGTKAYIRMECDGANKSVQFHAYGTIPSPHTDGRTIHLYEPDGAWTDEQWDDWEYECQHEIGHEAPENVHPHWKEVMEEKNVAMGTLLQMLYNLMSDHVQEHNRVGKYAGRDRILKKGRARFVNDRLLDKIDEPVMQPEAKIMKAAAVYDTVRRGKWNEWISGVGVAATLGLPDDELEIYNKLCDKDIRIEEGKNEWDAYQFALDILDAAGEDSKKHEEMNKEMKEAQSGKGKPQPGGDKGEGEGEEGEGAVGKGELSDEAKKEMEGMIYHTHYDKPVEGAYTSPTDGQHIEYPDDILAAGRGGFCPQEFTEMNLRRKEYGGRSTDPWRIGWARDAINGVEGGKLLAGQVRKLLISMKQSRWQHGEKRGKVSSKNVWKAKGPMYDDRVFKQKTTKLELDTAVTVLTDNSGSMAGDKFHHAAKAGVMLSEAMQKAGVPVELLSFSEDGNGPVHIVVKEFNERIGNESVLVDRYAECTQWMCQNSDGESIQWAYNRLIKRKEKRRVLIVLSDGSPAAYNGAHGAEYAYTHHVIRTIEDKTPVEIYGIGIMDTNVKRLYREHKVLSNASDLENMLIGLVKQKVLK